MNIITVRDDVHSAGFTIIDNIFDTPGIFAILQCIESADQSNPNFCKNGDLFAIRRFFNELPAVKQLVFTPAFVSIIGQVLGEDYFPVKSIYFDKPPASNWFVAYHQDLTIAVQQKAACPGFGPWTVKQGQFAVQPPTELLENNYTIRIHLDDTNEENGALKVIPASHLRGVWRHEPFDKQSETSCCVAKGGIMIIKPLLLHASGRSVNTMRRRVIHIEFSNQQLPAPLAWSEVSQPLR